MVFAVVQSLRSHYHILFTASILAMGSASKMTCCLVASGPRSGPQFLWMSTAIQIMQQNLQPSWQICPPPLPPRQPLAWKVVRGRIEEKWTFLCLYSWNTFVFSSSDVKMIKWKWLWLVETSKGLGQEVQRAQ